MCQIQIIIVIILILIIKWGSNTIQVWCTYYVITFVSDLRQIGDFLLLHRFLPPIKLTATI